MITGFTTTFLHTHSWLNWVDEEASQASYRLFNMGKVGLRSEKISYDHRVSIRSPGCPSSL